MLNPWSSQLFSENHTLTGFPRTDEFTVDPLEGFTSYLYTNDTNYGVQVFEEELACYDTPRGSVRCVPIAGKHDANQMTGGAPNAQSTNACPSPYKYLGKVCYNDTVRNAIFPDAKKDCGLNEVVYYPEDTLQNHIFRSAMMHNFSGAADDHTVWIGVTKDPFTGEFITQSGVVIHAGLADWADGEPTSGDCVVADKSLG
jgi:hypothetical protein